MRRIRLAVAAASMVAVALAAAAPLTASAAGRQASGARAPLERPMITPFDRSAGANRLLDTRAPSAAAQVESVAGAAAVLATHTVSVRACADEEFRAFYGTANWPTEVRNRVENADDGLFATFGINLVVDYVCQWDSNDAKRPICDIRAEFAAEVSKNPGPADMVIGFTKNPYSGGAGCVLGTQDYVMVGYQSRASDWKVTQHEVSHLYGAPDRYLGSGDPNPNHIDDVMEDPYNDYNYGCRRDRGIINSHVTKYD
jgi:hypothetical protein